MSFYSIIPIRLDVQMILWDLKYEVYNFHAHSFNMPTVTLPRVYQNEMKSIFRIPLLPGMHDGVMRYGVMTLVDLKPMVDVSVEKRPDTVNWHRDDHRQSVIIIPVSGDNPNHFTEFYDIPTGNISKVEYSQGVPVILDSDKLHRVSNNDPVEHRHVITISLYEHSYEVLTRMNAEDKLINHERLSTSFLRAT